MVTSVETLAWQRPLLIFMLSLIHLISDVIVKFWLCWNLLIKKLSATTLSNNIKKDFLAIQSDTIKLTKIPKHLAIAFLESSISIHEVAQLVLWSIACGAKGVSLYDLNGFIKTRQNELETEVNHLVKHLEHKPCDISWNGIKTKSNESSDFTSFTICLLSKEDGQEDIVQAARKLARHVANGDLKVDEVNETVLEANLGSANKGLPDPEVLLRFGLAHSNQGYPPWQIRLSEIHDMDTHHSVSYLDFLNILFKYSRCHQRFGHKILVMASAALEGYVNRLVSVITADGRNFVGTLKGFDQVINLILEDTHERVFSPNAGVEQVVLGLHIVRGDNIAVIGEIDEELDKRWDLSSVRAEPITSIVH